MAILIMQDDLSSLLTIQSLAFTINAKVRLGGENDNPAKILLQNTSNRFSLHFLKLKAFSPKYNKYYK